MPKETPDSKPNSEASKPPEQPPAPVAPSGPTTTRAMNVSRTLLTIGADKRLFPPNSVAELTPDEVERFRRRNLISILG